VRAGLHDFRQSGLTPEAVQLAYTLADECQQAGYPDRAGLIPTEADVQNATSNMIAEHDALEAALKLHRTNMVKESVRVRTHPLSRCTCPDI
jgi:hypothetical protein